MVNRQLSEEPAPNIHCACRQRECTSSRQEGLCNVEWRTHLLGVDSALQLGKATVWVDGSQKDGLVLVHACIGKSVTCINRPFLAVETWRQHQYAHVPALANSRVGSFRGTTLEDGTALRSGRVAYSKLPQKLTIGVSMILEVGNESLADFMSRPSQLSH